MYISSSHFQWKLPPLGLKGWLHLTLFISFFSMLLTSISWIIWSQSSDSAAAIFERSSDDIKYAYILNGMFILTAVLGIVFDTYRQTKVYFKRVLALNRELRIEEYDQLKEIVSQRSEIDIDRDISDTTIRLDLSHVGISVVEPEDTYEDLNSLTPEQLQDLMNSMIETQL